LKQKPPKPGDAPAKVGVLVAMAEALGLSATDFDAPVVANKAAEAAAVNHGGMPAQFTYLLRHADMDHLSAQIAAVARARIEAATLARAEVPAFDAEPEG
jgi:hypothetical protein